MRIDEFKINFLERRYMKTVLIDNYDSFTYNLFQQVARISGEEPIVVKNDAISFDELMSLNVDQIILSPGPGRPDRQKDFGICKEVILYADKPTLGVCLGHQGMAHFAGADVIHAPEPYHGRLSPVLHNQQNLFKDIPQSFKVVRYHSLVVSSLPDCLKVTAETSDGVIMGLEHLEKPFWGIQFHPESVSTEYGDQIIQNFLSLSKQFNAQKKLVNV